jgi:hypothetical protein
MEAVMLGQDAEPTEDSSREAALVALGPRLQAEARSFTDDPNLAHCLVHEALTVAMFGRVEPDPAALSRTLRSRAAHAGLLEPDA